MAFSIHNQISYKSHFPEKSSMRIKILFLVFFILTVWGNLNGQIDERQKAKNEVYSFVLTQFKGLNDYPFFKQEPPKPIPWSPSGGNDTIVTFDPVTYEEYTIILDAKFDSIRAVANVEAMKTYEQDYLKWKEMVEHGPKVIYISKRLNEYDLASSLEYYGLEHDIEIPITAKMKAPPIDVTNLVPPSKDFVLRNLPDTVKAFNELNNAVWALYFSDVYFNKTFDKAIMYIEECHYEMGDSCNNGPLALEKKNGVWQVLRRIKDVKQIQRE